MYSTKYVFYHVVGINNSWKSYERFTISDLIPDLKNQDAHLGYARDLAIKEFNNNILNQVPEQKRSSSLGDQGHSIITMASVCKSLATKNPITLDFNI